MPKIKFNNDPYVHIQRRNHKKQLIPSLKLPGLAIQSMAVTFLKFLPRKDIFIYEVGEGNDGSLISTLELNILCYANT